MTKKHSTKKALIASVLSLVLCFSMLIGTTFAWFTDSVTSANNIIKSGNLDIEMYWAEGKDAVPTTDAGWTDASQGAIFNHDKWEPGYTEVRHIKIANEGTLALKYKLAIVANGVVSDLADVIDVYYVDPAVQVSDRAQLTDANLLGTLTEVLANLANTANGELLAGENDTITLALKMQETAGNEYQNKSIGTNFAVQLLATQLTYEKDSFNDQYDVESDYVAEVKTADELATALRAGGLVKLANDISVTETLTVPAGVAAELDLNGKTITGTNGRDADNNRIHVIVNNGILTIKDGTVTSAGNNGGSAIYNAAGATLTIEDVTVYGAPIVAPAWPSYGINNYGNMTVNGATVNSYHGAIATGDNGVTVINDATVDVGQGTETNQTSWALYSFDNAQVTVNGGTFANTKDEKGEVYGGGYIDTVSSKPFIINGGTFVKTEGDGNGTGFYYQNNNLIINGGTFDANPSAYVANGYIATTNADGTYTVVKGATVADVADLKDALVAGGNIVLTEDIVLNSTLPAKNDAVIDLNGNRITAPSNGNMFHSSSDTDPSILITSSIAGAEINITGGDTAVLLGYGSTVIENVTINIAGCDNYSPNPFKVYGDLTIGEGTVVNIDYLGTALISNNGAVNIVIDGAEINIGTFKRNGVMIDRNNATTFVMKNTTMKIDNYVLSQFGGEGLISKIDGVTIENCTFDITDSNGASCTFVADAGLGRYDLVQN